MNEDKQEECSGTLSGTLSAYRWSGGSRFLSGLADQYSLDIQMHSIDGIFRQSIVFTVYGLKQDIRDFQDALVDLVGVDTR